MSENNLRILLVEDDESHAQYVMAGLKQSGHNVDHASDGLDGLHLATEETYDLLILDRMLPKIDGLSIVQTLRNGGNQTPILILSSLTNVKERVKGLRHGADDYLAKPFDFDELLARIEALARRAVPQQAERTLLSAGDLEMNLLTRVVKRAGQEIGLQNKEFQVLEFLLRRQDQVVTRTMLLEGVWDFHFNPNTNLLDAQISKLRLKIDKGYARSLIKTVKGAGYRLSAD
jgi:two-component system, OmpR family, response regulator